MPDHPADQQGQNRQDDEAGGGDQQPALPGKAGPGRAVVVDGFPLHKARQEGTGLSQGKGEGDIMLDPLVQGQQGQAQQGGEGGEGHFGASFGEMVFPDSVHAFEGKGKGGVWTIPLDG